MRKGIGLEVGVVLLGGHDGGGGDGGGEEDVYGWVRRSDVGREGGREQWDREEAAGCLFSLRRFFSVLV